MVQELEVWIEGLGWKLKDYENSFPMTFFGLTNIVMDDDFIPENVLVSAVCAPENHF